MIAINDIVLVFAISRSTVLAIRRDETVPEDSVANKVFIEVACIRHETKAEGRS